MGLASWRAVVLAAGRGPDDPMAKAFGVAHKCALPVAGKPMLARVIEALAGAGIPQPFIISIDVAAPARQALQGIKVRTEILASLNSAPASAIAAVAAAGTYPVLITTGDHALLTPEMVTAFTASAGETGADVLAGLATRDTIAAVYPQTRRTYFNLGGTHVSGCNLFAVMSERGLKLLEAWQHIERNRKKPWKLVAAFGFLPLVHFVLGTLTPERAFGLVSKRLGIVVRPVFMPFAEAAIDVDKPSDHALAEEIIRKRMN